MNDPLIALRDKLRAFTREREWDRYHTPKNLAMALIVEAAELAEHFQWLTAEESQSPQDGKREKIRDELADGTIYSRDAQRATALHARDAAIDEELMAALERWEALSSR